MAAVTRVDCHPVTPVGYEFYLKGVLTEAVVAGDLLQQGASGWSKAVAGATEAHGIALQDGHAGERGFSIGKQGEMDGWSGMTPGAPLYPSATVAGGLDTTPPATVVTRIRAISASRIYFNFV